MVAPTPLTSSSRLISLDVFRGLTIAGMIIVNNPGTWSAIYPPLEHAEWHGWTPTDLIFPFFLFIVGVAITFSYARRLEQGASRSHLLRHIVVRSLLLFGLGMILSGIPDYNFSARLILDVLQRIGVVYLLSAPLALYLNVRWQAVVAVACLIVYWLLMMLIPVPGYGIGNLAPEGNVWQYVDNVLLAGWHHHAEGILSLIPSISTVLFGALTGVWLRSGKSPLELASGMFVAGNAGMVAGVIMDIWFPINKLLWSSSYVVFTAGFALNLLGVCYWLLDIKGWKSWATPFLVFGKNAIAVFFLSSLAGRMMGLIAVPYTAPGSAETMHVGLKAYIFNTLFASWLSQVDASLAFALFYTLLWLGLMWILYNRKVFIKL